MTGDQSRTLSVGDRVCWKAFGDPISESQATDRSTFCAMPGGRSQAASDATRWGRFAWTLATGISTP